MRRIACLGLSIVLALAVAGPVAAGDNDNFVAVLSGGEEVPANASHARGSATFSLSPDGSMIAYRLIASNIENVVASHIHIAPAGTNGGVAVFLYGPAAAGGGRTDGVLATGTFTSADFVGPLANATMADLVDRLRDGLAYVNVHTNDGVAPTNTGPGDFPGGEIRGQIR
jgi:hypothetical protein